MGLTKLHIFSTKVHRVLPLFPLTAGLARAIVIKKGKEVLALRIVICDDDKNCADEINRQVAAFLDGEKVEAVIDVFYDSQSLIRAAASYDLAFLDIEMTPYSGIEAAKKLKEINQHILIFMITSYNRYLDDAMDLNVFRYIQKPPDPQRLQAGLAKALRNIDNNEIDFPVKHKNKTVRVVSSDIIYIEISGRSTLVVTCNGEYISDCKIDFWQKKLIASFFYRTHKSYIINIKYITSYQRDSITLCQKYQIPIAYRRQAQFRSFFFNYLEGR